MARIEWIENVDSQPFYIGIIARHQRHPVHFGGGCEQAIDDRERAQSVISACRHAPTHFRKFIRK